MAHLLCIAEAVLVEERDMIERLPLLRRQVGRRASSGEGRCIDFWRNRTRHVRMDAEQSLRRVGSHQVDDERTPISTLCDEFFIAEAFHQHRPGAGDALGPPAGRAWLSRKAVTWHRGDHQMECVRSTPAMGCWIGQRRDDLQLLDDRAWPPMRDDERQRILVHGTHMDEMDVEVIDFGHEVRQGAEPCLDLAPVIVAPPIAGEFL